MTKFLKKKFSSSIVTVVVILAVLITGLVVYTVTSVSLKQTNTESRASASSCSSLCSKMRVQNSAVCMATCQEVETGTKTCADLVALNRGNWPNAAVLAQCQKMTPVGKWCANVSCNLGQEGNSNALCNSVCMSVNQGGQTCIQACDAYFPKALNKQTPRNAACKAQCPSWIMPTE